jgi:hypothetical protein
MKRLRRTPGILTCRIVRKLINYFPERQYTDVIDVIIDGVKLNTARRACQMDIGFNEYAARIIRPNPASFFDRGSSMMEIHVNNQYRTPNYE